VTDRVIVYSGAIPLETDVLRTNKFAMMAVAKLAAAMLGTSTVVNGLACVPTGPAGLTVNVNPGEIYSLVNVDSTAYSSVAADTTHSILKQGVLLDTLNLACNPPGTGGQSINYLIQATYQDSDTDNVALPYYNASNPTQAWSGPNNTGTAQSTTRKGIITINAKAGTAATTGSQTTPAADSGYTGLWVVTVANGQTQITAGNIVQATNAPILPADLLHAIQSSSLITGVDTGSANACVVNYSYPVTALTDNMVLWFKAKAANTGATTLNVNGLGAQPVVGGNNSALQGGELVANGKAQVVWNATISSFVLLECTGAAVQVAPATQSQHAVQMAQAAGVVGSVRNLVMSVTAASATATLTADEIIVETALGGVRYCLPSFSKTINLATTGAGGMDTGAAPVSGYVALYAIYNPTTGTAALLAQNASTLKPNVYGGANMPAGYTASALLAVWPTNGSGQFVVGSQVDRRFVGANVSVYNLNAGVALSSLSLTSAVPANAKRCSGWLVGSNTNASASGIVNLYSNSAGTVCNILYAMITVGASSTMSSPFAGLELLTPQTCWFSVGAGTGTPGAQIVINSYEI
jgi:hypothetical protein